MSVQHDDSLRSEFKRFQYKPEKDLAKEEERTDSASDVRNALLVVATLIAAVTFQAGVNPPGGVWQDNSYSNHAGKAVLGFSETAFVIFLFSNTAAFSTSGVIIGILVQGFPFYYLVWLALLLMTCTYVASSYAVMPYGTPGKVIVYISFLVPFVLLIVRHLWRRIKKRCTKS